MNAVAITVVGSVNLDFVASAAKLPAPGETVTGASLARHPGGKGANQALAAQRLGARVRLVACVGVDAMAEEALALLRQEGVDLANCIADPEAATGVALISVAPCGENQIMVAPGANATFMPDKLVAPVEEALICQLELPIDTVVRAVTTARGFVAVNLAPAAEVPEAVLVRADLLVANEAEAAFYGDRLGHARGYVAVTLGARGARLFKDGRLLAETVPPKVQAVDATGAGDAFVGALTVALLEGQGPDDALAFACAAGALAATRSGAQPSLPRRAEVDARLRNQDA
jgi:ribokinase